MVHTITCIEGT